MLNCKSSVVAVGLFLIFSLLFCLNLSFLVNVFKLVFPFWRCSGFFHIYFFLQFEGLPRRWFPNTIPVRSNVHSLTLWCFSITCLIVKRFFWINICVLSLICSFSSWCSTPSVLQLLLSVFLSYGKIMTSWWLGFFFFPYMLDKILFSVCCKPFRISILLFGRVLGISLSLWLLWFLALQFPDLDS